MASHVITRVTGDIRRRFEPALVWRSLASRLVLATAPAAVTFANIAFNTPWRVKASVAAMFALTVASPWRGLLFIAAAAPLGAWSGALTGFVNFRLTEAIVLAFLAGWLVRSAHDRRGPSMPLALAWLLGLAIVLSVVVQARAFAQAPGELPAVLDRIVHLYSYLDDPIGVVAGARMIEGVSLAAAVVFLFRQRPDLANRLPVAFTVSAAIAAGSSVLLSRGIAPDAALARFERIGYRISGHVADINAAGSYFVMIAC